MIRKIALALGLVATCPLVVHAEDVKTQDPSMRARMSEVRDETRFHKMIDDAAAVYTAIAKGPHGEVPASVLKNSRCIAILPSVMTGALLVGGTHGKGVASCRDGNNAWGQPAAISLNQGSIGLQAGAKSADLVMFFQTQEATQALKRGNLALGSDISAVAGTFDSNVDTSAAGIVAYTRTEGMFAGAALNGGKVGKDDDETEAFYGKKVEYVALLEGRESPDSSQYSKKLTKLFP